MVEINNLTLWSLSIIQSYCCSVYCQLVSHNINTNIKIKVNIFYINCIQYVITYTTENSGKNIKVGIKIKEKTFPPRKYYHMSKLSTLKWYKDGTLYEA